MRAAPKGHTLYSGWRLVVGEVGSKVPELSVQLDVLGDARDDAGLAASAAIHEASTDQVLLSNVERAPEIVTLVLRATGSSRVGDNLDGRVVPAKASSLGEELVAASVAKLSALPLKDFYKFL